MRIIARFKLGGHIGSGGFGTVDEATEVSEDGELVRAGLARKTLLDKWLADPEAVGRFKREVRILDEMDHPNVLPVLGRNLSAMPPWFITLRADTNLADEVHKNGKAGDEDWAIRTFREILSGMAYAHSSRRVVHRDLKPENVLIVNGVAVVSDFGLGKRLDANTVDLTLSNIGMGTVAYMAPEQFVDAATVSYPADCYALGKILREMLTGNKPPVGAMKVDDVPAAFRSFIERCVADDSTDRYSNAADALAAFDMLVGSSASLDTDPSQLGLDYLLREWELEPEGQDQEVVQRINEYLVAHEDDEALYFKAIPRLPRLLIQQMLETPDVFDRILRQYNQHIQGALPFDYCDVVANFYRYVFHIDTDMDHRSLILARLIELGPTHNRWHVGGVVASLLSSIADGPIADLAAEKIRADPMHAFWYRSYVRNRSLATAVRQAFEDIDPTPASANDNPF